MAGKVEKSAHGSFVTVIFHEAGGESGLETKARLAEKSWNPQTDLSSVCRTWVRKRNNPRAVRTPSHGQKKLLASAGVKTEAGTTVAVGAIEIPGRAADGLQGDGIVDHLGVAPFAIAHRTDEGIAKKP